MSKVRPDYLIFVSILTKITLYCVCPDLGVLLYGLWLFLLNDECYFKTSGSFCFVLFCFVCVCGGGGWYSLEQFCYEIKRKNRKKICSNNTFSIYLLIVGSINCIHIS